MALRTEEQRQYIEEQRAVIQQFMASRGLTTYGWCKMAGLSEATLRHFLSGKKNESLTERSINLLASAAGVPSHRLRPNHGVAKSSHRPEIIDEEISKLAEEATIALLTMRDHTIDGCLRTYKQTYNIGVEMVSEGIQPSGGKIVVQWERCYGYKQEGGIGN